MTAARNKGLMTDFEDAGEAFEKIAFVTLESTFSRDRRLRAYARRNTSRSL
jgi:hypothetical protein